MSFLSFFGLGKRKAPWPEGIPCFYPNIADKDLIPIIPQHVLDERARWPILMILPLASRDSEVDDIALGVGLSRQLVYDLLLIPGLSIRGSSETPQIYLEAAHKQRKDRDPTIYISGTTTAGPGFTRVELSLFLPGRPVALATVIHETDFPTFYRNLFLAIAQGCGGQVEDNFVEKMLARLPTRDGLTELGRILVSYSSTSPTQEEYHERNNAALRLFHTKTCGTLPLELLSVAELESFSQGTFPTPKLWPELLQGLAQAPDDVQLMDRICVVLRGLHFLDNQRHNRIGKEHSFPGAATAQFVRRILELSPGFAGGYQQARSIIHPAPYCFSLARQIYRLRPGDIDAVDAWVDEIFRRPLNQEASDLAHSLMEEAFGLAEKIEDPLNQLQRKRLLLINRILFYKALKRSEEVQAALQEGERIDARIAELDPNAAEGLLPLATFAK